MNDEQAARRIADVDAMRAKGARRIDNVCLLQAEHEARRASGKRVVIGNPDGFGVVKTRRAWDVAEDVVYWPVARAHSRRGAKRVVSHAIGGLP